MNFHKSDPCQSIVSVSSVGYSLGAQQRFLFPAGFSKHHFKLAGAADHALTISLIDFPDGARSGMAIATCHKRRGQMHEFYSSSRGRNQTVIEDQADLYENRMGI